MLVEPSSQKVRIFTSWVFEVAQRRGVLLDERTVLTLEALSSHPAVRKDALERFLSELRIVSEIDWNVIVDDAVAQARSALRREEGTPDADAISDATYRLVTELLQMDRFECERIHRTFLAELAAR